MKYHNRKNEILVSKPDQSSKGNLIAIIIKLIMIQNNILNSSNNDASESFNNDSGDKIFDWNYVLLTQAF